MTSVSFEQVGRRHRLGPGDKRSAIFETSDDKNTSQDPGNINRCGLAAQGASSKNAEEVCTLYEQRRASLSQFATLSSVHLPFGVLLVFWTQTASRENPYSKRNDNSGRETKASKGNAFQDGVHSRACGRSGMAGQSEGRIVVVLGTAERKESQIEAGQLSHCRLIRHASTGGRLLRSKDTRHLGEHVVTFLSVPKIEGAGKLINSQSFGEILLSGASFTTLKNKPCRQGRRLLTASNTSGCCDFFSAHFLQKTVAL